MGVDRDQILANLRRRDEQHRREGQVRAAQLLAYLPAAIALLTQRYGARRVTLFGSLARGDATARSDVDLACEGIEPSRYFDALADLMTLFSAPVDLVRLEEAPESLLQRIAAEGRVA